MTFSHKVKKFWNLHRIFGGFKGRANKRSQIKFTGNSKFKLNVLGVYEELKLIYNCGLQDFLFFKFGPRPPNACPCVKHYCDLYIKPKEHFTKFIIQKLSFYLLTTSSYPAKNSVAGHKFLFFGQIRPAGRSLPNPNLYWCFYACSQ